MAKIKPLHILLGALFAAAGLTYLFIGLDIFPDAAVPVLGFIDDAFVMFALWILFQRAKKKLN